MNESIVSIKHLDHFYGQGSLRKQVLFDINLELQAGEVVILTGPSGCGKTTLLTLMGGLREVQISPKSSPQSSLKVFGQELGGANKNQLVLVRRHIGYIFQGHNLLKCLTAKQNVQMSLELHKEIPSQGVDSQTIAMLEAVGLEDRVNYYPDNLSGGQNKG